ncbi:MAG: hypothetical protein Q4F60_01395 [Candidatus Saccharibacteria bacterium]|nr:hypothetical protein [Candidatus Saccharibacteria bacterium]
MSKKRTPYETMKSFSWIYIIMAAFYGIGTIICFVVPELANGLRESLGGNDGMIKLGTSAGVVILLNLWYFWLARRVADKKSDGTLYGVLLILGIVSAIATFFTTKTGVTGLLSLDFIVDTIGLYYLAQVRKGGK